MNAFPLARTKWSNEHIMAALFSVIILYHIPRWWENPGEIYGFLVLISVGLFMDAAFNIIKYRRLWCCVSAAVTAGIISLLTPGIPLWKQIIGLAAALVFGKYLWGGTGKNKINPAIVGFLIIILVSNISSPIFSSSYLLMPAVILSIPFLFIRTHGGLGFIIGAFLGLLLNQDLSLASILSNGVFFWSCIILTDPVTVTRNPWVGLTGGFVSGFIAMFSNKEPWVLITLVLGINIISYIVDEVKPTSGVMAGIKIPKVFSYSIGDYALLNVNNKEALIDLSKEQVIMEEAESGTQELSAEEIIHYLKNHAVFGMGGGAFPTYKKLRAVLASKEEDKYLVINSVECDPGLIHDHYILSHYVDEIHKAIKVLNNCIGFKSIHLAVKACNEHELTYPKDISIHQVPDQYPFGAERILIREVLNIHLNKEQIPADYGILVLNIQTVLSIYHAIYLNKPSDTRLLTIMNMNTRRAKVAKVPMGMKLKDIVAAVYPEKGRIFAGGGIMQAYSVEEDAVVDKTINFIAIGEFPKYKESPQCSQCGNCIIHCPAKLRVNKIAELVDQGKYQEANSYNPQECISCGSCSYSCLAGRDLAQRLKKVKNIVKESYK